MSIKVKKKQQKKTKQYESKKQINKQKKQTNKKNYQICMLLCQILCELVPYPFVVSVLSFLSPQFKLRCKYKVIGMNYFLKLVKINSRCPKCDSVIK